MLKRTESKEMYLEVIYNIYLRGDEIRSIDIAKELGYTKPSVSRGVSLLKDAGLIEMQPYSTITLTEKGMEIAKNIKMRHNLLTKFLMKSLDIDKETAEHDACRIEHVISEKAIDAIKNYLDEE